ncbi:hypothetical protein B0H12DRAFT_1083560 [Mycena haematopus]|nr:hypothetical protein B0H12DRAFT_1083560 [Mycena haematopus]
MCTCHGLLERQRDDYRRIRDSRRTCMCLEFRLLLLLKHLHVQRFRILGGSGISAGMGGGATSSTSAPDSSASGGKLSVTSTEGVGIAGGRL